MGPKYAIIKKGKDGAELFNYEKTFVANAYEVEKVIDPTGAGDCFIGGITGYLSQSSEVSFESIKSAIDYGTSLASFNVENMATKNLLNLSINDIKTRINKLKKVSDQLKHECGIGLVHLKKPLNYYNEKYLLSFICFSFYC